MFKNIKIVFPKLKTNTPIVDNRKKPQDDEFVVGYWSFRSTFICICVQKIFLHYWSFIDLCHLSDFKFVNSNRSTSMQSTS